MITLFMQQHIKPYFPNCEFKVGNISKEYARSTWVFLKCIKMQLRLGYVIRLAVTILFWETAKNGVIKKAKTI